MREIILKKYLLCCTLLPLIAGCQTNFVAIGPYKKLNKSLVYKLNNSIDTDKTIEKTSAAINAKKKIVGEYRVENKWTAFISADVKKINILRPVFPARRTRRDACVSSARGGNARRHIPAAQHARHRRSVPTGCWWVPPAHYSAAG